MSPGHSATGDHAKQPPGVATDDDLAAVGWPFLPDLPLADSCGCTCL